MNSKNKYIRELEKKIKRLPKEEQHDVIGYYMEYLVDSNIDTYDEAVALLGTPNNVAAKLLSEQYLKAAGIQQELGDDMQPAKRSRWKVILAVIAAIFAIPIAVPLAIALVLVVLALILVLLVMICTFFLLALVLLAVGIATLIIAISTLSVHLLTSIYYTGGALVLLGFGTLTFQFSVFFAKKSFDLLRMITTNILKRGEKSRV